LYQLQHKKNDTTQGKDKMSKKLAKEFLSPWPGRIPKKHEKNMSRQCSVQVYTGWQANAKKQTDDESKAQTDYAEKTKSVPENGNIRQKK
jgi:hypothetical protein